MTRTNSTSYPPPRPNTERKGSLTRTNAPSDYDAALVSSLTKTRKNYGIYPSATSDMFIYERSVSAASDGLASSSSSSSSDSDESHSSAGHQEVSSIRASSSTETLEATTLSAHTRASHPAGVPPLVRTHSSSGYSRGPQENPAATVLQGPPAVQEDASRYGAAPHTFAVPLHFAETLSDSDSDTIIDEPLITVGPPRRSSDSDVVRANGRREVAFAVPPSAPYPIRRDSDGSSSSRSLSGAVAPTSTMTRYEDPSALRAPPGLGMTTSYDGGDQLRRVPAHPAYSGSGARAVQRPPPIASAPSRQYDASVAAMQGRMGDGRRESPQRSGSLERSLPERAETIPIQGASLERGASVTPKRSVRWAENLICPDPVPRSGRRKGWYNRRGDQLWTNAGRYKSPEPGKEYPPDLTGYPEPNCGWMNEEGIRIDIEHRLIPKPPLRPALKRHHANTL